MAARGRAPAYMKTMTDEQFAVAFSLAGEQRGLIEPIATGLRDRGHRVFYYGWPEFQARLATPHLDLELRRIYGTQTRLLVPVLSADYARKPWTSEVEFTVVREMIFGKHDSLMPLRADDVPIEGFSKLHGYLDLRGRAPADVVDLIEQRLRFITEAAGSSASLDIGPAVASTVPALPRPFVARPAELARLRDALLESAPAGDRSPAIAVHGMPGVGKTSLVQALCAAPEVRMAFTTIVWLTIGRTRQAFEGALDTLEAALGLITEGDTESRLARIRQRLTSRRALVVLDDVWSKDYVRPLMVDGAASRLVFTSRDRTLALALGAREFEIGVLEPGQAVQLLRESTGREDDLDVRLAERLGFHPLAVRLAAVQLRDGRMSVAQWLAGFNALSQLKLGRAASSRDDSLLVCFDTTTDQLTEHERLFFYSLGIFPFQVPVPEATVLRFWRQMGRAPADAMLLLVELERLALLDRDARGITLHDLLRQYARERLGPRSRSLHHQLLKSYGATDPGHVPADADAYYLRFAHDHFREAKIASSRQPRFGSTDIWGWMRALLRMSVERHPPLKPPHADDGVVLGRQARLAVLGNWGTGLYGAPAIAQAVRDLAPFDLLLHIGNVYYTGTEREVRNRFLRFWPAEAGKVSRALNGNHQMYSGGFGHFDHLLPALGQTSSYFVCENADWVIVALDTAYVNASIDDEQRLWLDQVGDRIAGRRVLLFTHHYPVSLFEATSTGARIRVVLSAFLAKVRVTAWYWGHEHRCVIYEASADDGGALGRCVGHSGYPAKRLRVVRRAPVQASTNGITWRRFEPTGDSPGALVLDGPNLHMPGREETYAPHGFVTLELDGPRLRERVHVADGTTVFDNTI